jgi:Ran GTPase-activating protein (RanGAP) involved in mRNA processing and transport/Ca2+-binding EF-hand superfamily protein
VNAAKYAKNTSPTQDYLEACEELGIVPNLMPFVTGHSSKLKAASQSLGDMDLLPVVAMLSGISKISEVDLSGNLMLTEKSLVPLLGKLFGKPASATLDTLNLSSCLRNATSKGMQETLETVVQLLCDDNGVKFLKHLDLSSISMGMQTQVPLCHAIRGHSYLRSVRLSDIGLRGNVASRCVDELMNCPMLQTLDLGWNCFSADIFSNLGERICGSKNLQTLCVPNCSGTFKFNGGDNPIQFLLEQLARDESLTSLDISMNRIDFRGAVVLEDALINNGSITDLNISHNPLGMLGMRSLFRLLSRDTCALMHIIRKETSSSLEDDVASGIQQFSVTNPGGRYVLHMHRPYHRALLRMFYRTSERFSLDPQLSLTNLEYSKGKYQHADKDNTGVWMVPHEGILKVTFDVEPAMEVSLSDVPRYDFQKFLDHQLSMMKMRPSVRKIIPLLAELRKSNGDKKEFLVLLDALARDFQFTYPQVRKMCEDKLIVAQMLQRLTPCLLGGDATIFLSFLLVPTTLDYLQLLRRQKVFLNFNIQNLTGRHSLDLSNPGDQFVATAILLIDRWEAVMHRKLNRIDTSQRGNGSHMRNEKYNDLSLQHLQSMAEWRVPESGELVFDYASSKRPPQDALPMDVPTFTNLLRILECTDLPSSAQLEALRRISHLMFLRSKQLREVLGIYRDEDTRANLYIMLIMQVKDMHNEKVFRVRFEKRESLGYLNNRLGQVTFFPFMQPEQTYFQFDFGKYDERLACHALMTLCAKEGWGNVTYYAWIHADGTEDPLPQGIPRSWEAMEKMPSDGFFRGRYNCAPECRNYRLRADLMEKFSLWEAPEEESQVKWWAILTETPVDVLEYLEFLVAKFPSRDGVFKAFFGIDGNHESQSNGTITFREFEDSIRFMRCKKFKGENEKARITSIFRFLDPSGEGQVSKDEWAILDLLFQEIRLSIEEFVRFLTRTFGEDLQVAWDAFDEDGGGTIQFHEWRDKLTQVGYFGPSKPIFSFLDKDDGGDISYSEFQALADFQTNRVPEDDP